MIGCRSALLSASGASSGGDVLVNASLLYALRNLGSYSGSIVEVRRSSDNATSDFTASQITDGTLTAWVGAGNNGFVRTWYNQVNNTANNMVQTTTSAQPQIVSSGSLTTRNGLPTLVFNGSRSLAISTYNLSNTQSIYTEIYTSGGITSTTYNGTIWRSTAATDDAFYLGPTTGALTDERISWLTIFGPNVYGHGQVSSDYAAGSRIFSALLNNASPSIYAKSTSADSIQQTLAIAQFGNRPFTTTVYPRTLTTLGSSFTGEISEFRLYNSVFHGTTDRQGIENAMGTYYQFP